MSETGRKWPFKLPKLGRKQPSSGKSGSHGQRVSDVLQSPAKDIALLEDLATTHVRSSQSERGPSSNSEEGTTGSLTIHSRTDPNVNLRSSMSRSTSAAQAEAMPTKVEIAASEIGAPTDYAGANSKPDLDVSHISTDIPYALTWSEHEMELRPVKPLKSSDHPEMTPNVFNRWGHSFTAIPNSSGEFIIFGGIHEEKKSWTNDVVLLSTTDMSLTALETNGAKPDIRADHGAVISGRVLIVFGGSSVESHLHFLNLDTREWSKLRPPAPYPGPRFGHSFIMVDNTIWLYGGLLSNSLPVSDDMWCIDLAAGIGYARWRQVPKKDPWPEVRGFHSTVYYDGCLYMFAGEALGTGEQFIHYNDLWKFEIRTETWVRVQCDGMVPQPRASLAATVIKDNMFIFGGSILEAGTKSKVSRADHAFVFNFRDSTWRSLAMLGFSPPPLSKCRLLTLESQIVVVGGAGGRGQRIHLAETRAAGHIPDSLIQLQFTTETTKLKFTTNVVDLSRFVRKQGNSAHSLAGFSDVWKGEMTETGQTIAIKVLRVTSTGNLDDPESGRLRTRFDRELTIWMGCQHPRVLELLGYAYIEGIPCLISPWCSNGNIMEYLSKNSSADRRRLIIQVAEGLVYLHGRELPVVHSDIKPANVLVSDEGNAKLCDFGISKLVLENTSGFTTTASVKGTLRYSSPEMLDLDGQSTTSSDVWAFGMLVLHVMTSKIPYVNVLSDAKVIMAIMSGHRPLPENYPELPSTDPLWDIMGECWCEDPMEKPTMAEVLDKLLRLDDSNPVEQQAPHLPGDINSAEQV